MTSCRVESGQNPTQAFGSQELSDHGRLQGASSFPKIPAHTKSSSCSTVLFLGLVTLVVILICRCIFYHFGSTLCHSSLLYYALIFSALFVLQLRTLYTCIFTYTHQTNAHSKKAYSSSLGMSFMAAEAIQRLSGITTQRLNCKT